MARNIKLMKRQKKKYNKSCKGKKFSNIIEMNKKK